MFVDEPSGSVSLLVSWFRPLAAIRRCHGGVPKRPETINNFWKYEVLTSTRMRISVFWDIVPFTLVMADVSEKLTVILTL